MWVSRGFKLLIQKIFFLDYFYGTEASNAYVIWNQKAEIGEMITRFHRNLRS